MKLAIVTVGLGFGDEGKGATVDWLCRQHKADLVVRYSGGPQCRHTVIDGEKRHSFSQFGSGTFAGVRTFYSRYALFDPAEALAEAQKLRSLGVNTDGMLLVDPHAVVITPFHRALNRAESLFKRQNNTCGMGIGQARKYWLDYGADSIVARDLLVLHRLRSKLELMRQRTCLAFDEYRQDDRIAQQVEDPIDQSSTVIAKQMQDAFTASGVGIGQLPQSEITVFEGAQGVLLDEHFGFPPYNTWSTVTASHAYDIMCEEDYCDYMTLGVMRPYMTRHGDGPLPTRTADVPPKMIDNNNPFNPWQGYMRFGWFDSQMFLYAVEVAKPDCLAVNCWDHIESMESFDVSINYSNTHDWYLGRYRGAWPQEGLGRLLQGATPVYRKFSTASLLALLQANKPVYTLSRGPSAEHRTELTRFSDLLNKV